MRTISAQIDAERALGVLAHGHASRTPTTGRPPAGHQPGIGAPVHAHHIQKPRSAGNRALGPLSGSVAHRRQAPGHPLGPFKRRGIEPDLLDRVSASDPHLGQRVLGRDHGPALLGQTHPVVINANENDSDLRTLPQSLNHAGNQPQSPGPVKNHHHRPPLGPRTRTTDRGPLLDHRQNPIHLTSHRTLINTRTHPYPTRPGTHVRQPPYPVPSTPRPDRVGRISQNHQVQLSRGMQARALSDHPPGRHTSPRPGHTDNPQPAQRHTDGHISHRPPQRLLIRGPLGHTQLHPTGHISRAHTHIEPVLIVRTPLPQPGPRTAGPQQHLSRIRLLIPTLTLLTNQRLKSSALRSPLSPLIISHRPPMRPLTISRTSTPISQHHHRREQNEQQRRHPTSHNEHHHPHHHRSRQHQPRERLST